ncbi:MAG: hypothetical protein M3R27_01285 [Bacteroidota bacterium]|nr:hypothetical protein [Bacteroidota bacterium]
MLKQILLLIFILKFTCLYPQSKAKRGTITVKRNAIFEFDRGEGLFQRNCSGCHMPYFYSHEQRVYIHILTKATQNHDMKWLTRLCRFPAQLAKAGDPDIIAINKKVKQNSFIYLAYPKARTHPDFHMLDNGQVMAIFFYVDSLNRRKEAWKSKSDEN